MKNHFQTRIPYLAKSSLEGKIKIKFSVMQGFNNFTSHVEDAFHQKSKSRKMKTRDPGNKGSTKTESEGNSQDDVEGMT